MRTLRLLLASLIVTTGCYGSVAGTPDGQGDNGSSEKAPSDPNTPETVAKGGASKTPATSAESQSPSCDQDASVCDQTEAATKVVVTLDGKSCAADVAPGETGLDMGLDTHGWQYSVTSDDCGFILNVSGLDNAAYPQNALVTFDQTEAIQLFTDDQNGDADGGVGGGTFLSSLPGASAVIESGPVNHVAKTIKGHGTVPNQDGTVTHDVTFEMDF